MRECGPRADPTPLLDGEPLYAAMDYAVTERFDIALPDAEVLPCARMVKGGDGSERGRLRRAAKRTRPNVAQILVYETTPIRPLAVTRARAGPAPSSRDVQKTSDRADPISL